MRNYRRKERVLQRSCFHWDYSKIIGGEKSGGVEGRRIGLKNWRREVEEVVVEFEEENEFSM